MTNGKSQEQLLEEISKKLDSILALLAVRGLEGDIGAMVEKLDGMGLGNHVIRSIVGLKPKAVQKRIQRLRKKSKPK